MKHKNTIIPIIVLALVFIGAAVYLGQTTIIMFDSLSLIVILLLVPFASMLVYHRWNSLRHGQPGEDEFSRLMLQKASSRSYYISLYLWLGILYLYNSSSLEPELLIGGGIMIMALLFALNWLILKIRGLSDA